MYANNPVGWIHVIKILASRIHVKYPAGRIHVKILLVGIAHGGKPGVQGGPVQIRLFLLYCVTCQPP